MFSIVIPAFNEEAVIGRCLRALLDTVTIDYEVIVVCNGCTDKTAEIASGFDGVTVIETEVASKTWALNLGDSKAQYFPRVFLDADVEISGRDLVEVVKRMEIQPGVKVGAPALKVDYSRSSWAVKAFYKVWTSLPYFKSRNMIGSGVYILTKLGRDNFHEFPDIIADDAYIRSQFEADERYTDSDYSFTIFAPRRLEDLIKIKTRARFGNMELTRKYPNLIAGKDHGLRSLIDVILKQPALFLSSFVYVYVQFSTMRRAKTRLRLADFKTWERDESVRLVEED